MCTKMITMITFVLSTYVYIIKLSLKFDRITDGKARRQKTIIYPCYVRGHKMCKTVYRKTT